MQWEKRGKMKEKEKKVIIAGAGVMGASIAQVFAGSGYEVVLYDVRGDAIAKGRELIHINQKAAKEEGYLTEAECEERLGRICFCESMECFRLADFVIEAIVENREIKKKFWGEISQLVSEDAILTSNTSGLSITDLAEAVERPERFCGLHWLNPPHICPLVEIICGTATTEKTVEKVREISIDVGKVPVVLKKEIPGFLINRFQFAILREAMSLVESGIASLEDVDKVFKYGLGMRYACLGPFEIADLGGLDTFYQIGQYLFPDLSDTKKVSHLLADLVEKGAFGVKSQSGFYDYSGGKDREMIEKRDKAFMKIVHYLYEENYN